MPHYDEARGVLAGVVAQNATLVATATHAATSKATPVDADEFPLADSAASFTLKKLTWANLKAAISAALSGPCVSVYASATQSVPTGVSTKLTLDTEEFDTANNFTASRFTPTVAGYYQVSCCVFWNSSGPSGLVVTTITKNAATYKNGYGQFTSLGYASANVDALVLMNGTTDYIEIYVTQYAATSQLTSGGATAVFMTAARVG
jgi:hypothetical protein